MKILIEGKTVSKTDEKVILVAILGILTALEKKSVTIDEAEKFLFSPKMVDTLRKANCSEKTIELASKGCELEDIASLIPEKWEEILSELVQDTLKFLIEYEELNKNFWIE